MRSLSVPPRRSSASQHEAALLLLLLAVAVVWSGISPADWRDWLLELAPVFVGVSILIATRRRFPLTPMSYRLAFLIGLLLAIGGRFMFSRVPLASLEHRLHLSRNPYDRIVHFCSGFGSAILGRELLRRKTGLSRSWVFFITAACCLAGAALYELLEWAAAVWNVDARAFVSAQGDRWDAHWDMLTTFVGALASLSLLSRSHDRQIAMLAKQTGADARVRPTSRLASLARVSQARKE